MTLATDHRTIDTQPMSCAFGIPLTQEQDIGALTLGEYLREVTSRFGPREAAVIHLGHGGDTRGDSGDNSACAERWSYSELWERSVEVARALIALGVGKGTRVGLLMTNRLEFLSCFFGTALAGGVATTISTFFTASELDEVLKASGCSVLLLERSVLKKDFAQMLNELEPKIGSTDAENLTSTRFPFLRHLAMVDSNEGNGAIMGWQTFCSRGEAVSPAMVEATSAAVAPSDPGALFFSSGSTGKAKGILSAHRGVCLQLWRGKNVYNFSEPPRTWSSNGFFFSGNFCQALSSALTCGGTLILQRWFDAEAALSLMAQERASMLLAWPHQWAQLEAAENYLTVDLSAMHYIDARCPIAKHPTISTNWQEPRQAYGCTETFTLISGYPSGTAEEVMNGSNGLPTAGSTIKIVDPLTGTVVPIGERGEIAVKGPTLMLGYIGIPLDETLDSEGFFRTNDGGYIDDAGRLFWEGRLNDIIKTGGANVSPLEIDAVIRNCPGVKISQTVGVPDEMLGELVVTCIVAHDGKTLSDSDIVSFAKQQLASYKVPRKILFCREDELQTTGSAKIKTAELRRLAEKRIASHSGSQPA